MSRLPTNNFSAPDEDSPPDASAFGQESDALHLTPFGALEDEPFVTQAHVAPFATPPASPAPLNLPESIAPSAPSGLLDPQITFDERPPEEIPAKEEILFHNSFVPDIALQEGSLAQEFPPLSDPRALGRTCEPVFQMVCRLNRMKRSPEGLLRFDVERIRYDFVQLFDEMTVKSISEGCSPQFNALQEPLRCFVDIVMTRAGFPFADEWRWLTSTVDPDATLFGSASELTPSADSSHRQSLEILYMCLCLTVDILRLPGGESTAMALIERIDGRIHRDESGLFCPAAYDGVFTRAILTPVGRRLRSLAAGSAALILLAIAGAVGLNLYYYQQLDHSIRQVRTYLEHGKRSVDTNHLTSVGN
ncbi:MAG TPA: hypothetical protein VG326_05430 [Tepidisphaeraceae bacterium]|jgi:hypothetical protein|nr:hypothetical protein [Tepidisphaeraceae bacterium]